MLGTRDCELWWALTSGKSFLVQAVMSAHTQELRQSL